MNKADYRDPQITKIAVVIPAYKVLHQIRDVIQAIPAIVNHIIVVDDACPQSSGKEAEKIEDKRIIVIYHDENRGVGKAMSTGYKRAMDIGADIIVKLDGDGQMDPLYIGALIAPILNDTADYSKGNRFYDVVHLFQTMPKVRFFGNSVLSFMVKLASGYWNMMDPTNGFTAVHRNVLEKINLDRISDDYFFEIDMLIRLNIANAVLTDVYIPPKYGEEISSLKLPVVILKFPYRLIRGLIKRIFLKYYIYDFNMLSIYLLFGIPMFLFGVFFGIYEWLQSIVTGTIRSAGTIMLTALPIIIGFQMLLQAIQMDIDSVPKRIKQSDKL